jgi:hypothetical protein
MWPALNPHNTATMQITGNEPGSTLWVAQSLKQMTFPWSINHLVNAPHGAQFWSLSFVVNGVLWLALWVETRFISPMLAFNILVWTGWVLSGLAAYALAKYLGSTNLGAVSAGLFVESLPWMREKVLTHFEYTFFCMPLFIVLLTLRWVDLPSRKRFLHLVSFQIFLFFFSLYWFYMCAAVVAVILLVNIKTCWHVIRKLSVISQASLFMLAVAIPVSVKLLYDQLRISILEKPIYERPLDIANREFIDYYNGSITRFIRPHTTHLFFPQPLTNSVRGPQDIVNYVGVVILALALFTVIYLIKNKTSTKSRHIFSVLAVVIATGLLTLPTYSGAVFGLLPGPARFIRFLMPGARVFARFGMITEALLCVLAGTAISRITMLGRHRLLRTAIAILLACVAIVDLNPLGRRLVDRDYKTYESIRLALNQEPGSVVFQIGMDLSPEYPPLNYVDAATLFNWAEYNDGYSNVYLQATRGDENLAAYLASRYVTHLIVPLNPDGSYGLHYKWTSRASIDLDLKAPLFVEEARAGGHYPAVLLKINIPSSAKYCNQCSHYKIKWAGVRNLFYEPGFDQNKAFRFYEDGSGVSWVHPSETPTFFIDSVNDSADSFEVTLSLAAAFGSNAQPQIVIAETNNLRQVIRLRAGEPTVATFHIRGSETVSLRHGLPCTILEMIEPGNSGSSLCYGITNIKVLQTPSP